MRKVFLTLAMIAVSVGMMAQTKFHDVEAQEATGPVKSIVSSIMGNEHTVNMMGQEMTATVAYNDKGAPMSETINVAGQFLVTAYSDYQYDDHGNWISRKATIQGQTMDQARTITYYE